MLMAVSVDRALGASPLFDRPILRERFKLTLPDLAIHQRPGVGAYKPFTSALRGAARADLGHVILDPDEIRLVVAVDVLNANFAAQDGFGQLAIGAAALAGARLVTLFVFFSFVAFDDVHDIELKAGVAFIVDGHAPNEVISVARLETSHVGPAELVGANALRREHGVESDAPLAFLGFDLD